MLVQLQEGLQHVPAVVKAPLCFKKISSTDFFTIVPSGTNLEKPLGTFRKLLALPEAGRLPLVRGAGMGDVGVGEGAQLFVGEKDPAQQKLLVGVEYFHCFKER